MVNKTTKKRIKKLLKEREKVDYRRRWDIDLELETIEKQIDSDKYWDIYMEYIRELEPNSKGRNNVI